MSVVREKINSDTDLRDVDTIVWPDGEIGGIVQTADSGNRALINRGKNRDWFSVEQLSKTNARILD